MAIMHTLEFTFEGRTHTVTGTMSALKDLGFVIKERNTLRASAYKAIAILQPERFADVRVSFSVALIKDP